MTQITIAELWSYPVKGCQGVRMESLEITQWGVTGDREFALWHDGQLVDQKEHPIVASIAARLDSDRDVLVLANDTAGEFVHPVQMEGKTLPTQWILDTFESIDQGDAVAEWLTRIVGIDVRLVRPGEQWRINFPIPQFELLHDQPKQSFFAASPVSLGNQASLDDLNARLSDPVEMDRFRVNVVVNGLDAYREDDLHTLAGETASLRQVMPAERCIIITTDQKTGERPKSDLMKVLSEYRRKPAGERFGTGLIFSSYMNVASEGTLRVGEHLEASWQDEPTRSASA